MWGAVENIRETTQRESWPINQDFWSERIELELDLTKRQVELWNWPTQRLSQWETVKDEGLWYLSGLPKENHNCQRERYYESRPSPGNHQKGTLGKIERASEYE